MKTDKITLDRIKTAHPALRVELEQMYLEMCAALTGRAMVRFAYVLRSYAEQDALFAQGRTKPGKIVTNARGGRSYHCYSDDTMVLTENGWMFFKDLKDEKVMVFKDDKIYYEQPKNKISWEHNGEMIHVETRSVDLLVTPDHRFITKRKTNGVWDKKWGEVLAKDLDYKHKIPMSGDFVFENQKAVCPIDGIDTETWWEFMGWYLSEGSCVGVSDGKKREHSARYRISISQSNNKIEWDRISDVLTRMNVKFNYIGHEFLFHSKKIWEHLFEIGNQYNRRIPRYLFNADKEHLELLLESLILGDGTNYDSGRIVYYSVHEKLCQDVAELMVILGYPCNVSEREERPNQIMPHGNLIKNAKPQYTVATRIRKTHELRNGSSNYQCINKIEYSGMVYCVETEAGALVVQRNGKVSICGNCFGLAFDIVLLVDRDGNGTHESASWETNVDFDGDGKSDWQEVVAIAKQYGWEWGGSWARFSDMPHFQKTFGLNVVELDRRVRNKIVINNIYPKLGSL
jgi:hypothetical protein